MNSDSVNFDIIEETTFNDNINQKVIYDGL